MTSHAILLALVPVFFVLGLGFGAGRFGIVDNRQVDGLNALVMKFALPASLFAATASASPGEIIGEAPLFAILTATMLIVYFGWFLLARRLAGASPAEASVQALTVGFPNLAGVGLPVMSVVVGTGGTLPVAVALAAGSIVISPLTLVMLELASGGAAPAGSPFARMRRACRRALTTPVVLAPAAGILLSSAGLPLGEVARACFTLIGQAAAGGALFLTGLVLSARAFRLDWRIVAATAVADVLRPLVAAAIVFLLPVPTEVARTAVLLAAVPSGFFGILFAVNYRLDSAVTGSMVTASTVFSIGTLAVAIAAFGGG